MRWLIVDENAEFRQRLSQDFHFSDSHENVVVAGEDEGRQQFVRQSFDGVVADWAARHLLVDIRAGRVLFRGETQQLWQIRQPEPSESSSPAAAPRGTLPRISR